jgi:hypothetical protein
MPLPEIVHYLMLSVVSIPWTSAYPNRHQRKLPPGVFHGIKD